jgi:hypothetical protein
VSGRTDAGVSAYGQVITSTPTCLLVLLWIMKDRWHQHLRHARKRSSRKCITKRRVEAEIPNARLRMPRHTDQGSVPRPSLHPSGAAGSLQLLIITAAAERGEGGSEGKSIQVRAEV